jgi:MFS transporter, MHS family, proline/betaine transporter
VIKENSLTVEINQKVSNPREGQILKVLFSGGIGTTMEFYDFGVYGYLASDIAKHFFSSRDPVTALLVTLAIFAVAFATRPIGSVIFGHLGDRHGRRSALSTSVGLMALATFCIGVLPDYVSIGISAPIILVAFRLLQGFAAGGEIGGAATLLAEASPASYRGMATSVTAVGATVGLLLASGVISVVRGTLPSSDMAAWGWRIPFILALPTGLVGLYVRTRLKESSIFEKDEFHKDSKSLPIVQLFNTSRAAIAQSVCIGAAAFTAYYLTFVYLGTYLHTSGRLSDSAASLSTVATLIISAIAIPLFGLVSDRLGRRPVLAISALSLLFLPLPLFRLMQGSSATFAISAQILMGVCVAAGTGPLWITIAELFPTKIRYTGVGFSYSLGITVLGGTSPFMSAWLISMTNNPSAPAWYVMSMAVVSLVALLTVTETANKPLMK